MKEKASLKLFWCLFFVYIANVIGKTSFSAATVALVSERVLTKTQAGLISGLFWICYGTGQFIGGFIVNRVRPYLLLKIGVLSSMTANLLMTFEDDYFLMLFIWGVSGLLQFGLWPAILRLVSTEMIEKQRAMTMTRFGYCYCLGSVVSYLLTTLLLKIGTYHSIFICCTLIVGLSYLAVEYASRKLSGILRPKEPVALVSSQKKGKFTWSIVWSSCFAFFCVMMVFRSILDTGIKNWMPTILMETYGASPSFTSLLSVVLLLTNLLGVTVAETLYAKKRHDELGTLRVIYLILMPLVFLLLGFEHLSIYLTTILMTGVTMLVYGSNPMIALHYPIRFQKWSLVATSGAIINGFASIGNMIATYGSGYVADHFGWNTLLYIWGVMVVVFVLITIFLIPTWKKFRGK